MSEALKRPSHATADWSRSSFFDADNEMLIDLALDDSDAEEEFEKIDTDEADVDDDDAKEEEKFVPNPAMSEIIESMKHQFGICVHYSEIFFHIFCNRMPK